MFRGSDTNSFRYFLARFKTFARPQFWLVGLGLVGLVGFAWEFSQHPTWRQALTGKAENNLTPEEKEGQSIGAEIDSLPLLSADFNPQKPGKPDFATADELAKLKLPPLPDGTKGLNDNSQTMMGQAMGQLMSQPMGQLAEIDSLTKLFGGSANRLGNANNAASATLTALSRSPDNPLLGSSNASNNANNAARLSTLLSGSSSGSSINNGGSSSTGATGNVRSSNQLSEALNRYSPATPNPNAPINVQPSEPSPTPTGLPQYTPGLAGNAPVNVPTYNNLPPVAGTTNVSPGGLSGSGFSGGDSRMNSYTGLTSGSVPDSLSSGSFGNGVATPIPIGTSGSIPVLPGSTPLPPGTTSIAVPPPAPVSPPPAPFTTPRSIPGRILGGGEINTFSNP